MKKDSQISTPVKNIDINHDVLPGHLDRCQVCGSKNLELVIDLGHQPLCDSLLTKAMLNEPEQSYPLRQMRCTGCTLNQLDYVVDGNEVYHPEYPYKSGVTNELVVYQKAMAKDLFTRHGLSAGQLVLDIGSNDGTLLSGFKECGAKVVGVEPTNISKYANEAGIETYKSFFNQDIAERIVEEHDNASMITATNVFAHMAPLGEVMRGIMALLADDGVVVIENHYLGAILDRTQFDSVYHEHIRTYSLKSLVTLFSYYDMDVFDAELVSRYGGNIRIHACRTGKKSIKNTVKELLRREHSQGYGDAAIYDQFRGNVSDNRQKMMEQLYNWKNNGAYVVGNSCPGRCSTLINYYGIDETLLPYLAEQPTSLKKGLYLPGKHLPIIDNSILQKEQPDYIILMAWHYQDAIVKYLRDRGVKSKLVVPLPEFRVLDH